MVNNLTFNKLNRRYGILLIGTPTRQFYFNLSAYEYCNRLLLEKGVLIKTVFNGIVPDDAKFARESTLALIRSINLSFNLLFRDFGIQSLSPLEKEAGFYFHKKDLLKYALKAGLPIEKTWSCGKNGWYHCGICPSCRTRISVFEEAGIKDKTIYFVNLISRFKQYLKNSVLFDLYCLFKRKIAIRPSRKNVSVDASSIISINEMVEWYKKEEDIFLLHKKYGDLEVLNESGSFVWEQISSTRKIVLAELTKKLAKKYNLSSKRADNDLKKIIKSLIRKEYLNVSNGQAG